MPKFPDAGSASWRNPTRALLLLCVTFLLACSSTTLRSASGVTIVSVTDLGAIQQDPRILGRDGAYSALFQEYDINGGRTFFLTYSRATGEFTSEVRLVEVQVKPAG